MVPTWTLLAALTAGLILGALASRILFKPAAAGPPPALEGPREEQALGGQPAEEQPLEPPSVAEEPLNDRPAEEPAETEPAEAEAPALDREVTAPAPAEPIRISMEDVVSELERRYQGRQADSAPERPKSAPRRRKPRSTP